MLDSSTGPNTSNSSNPRTAQRKCGAAVECTVRDFLHRQVDRDLVRLVSQPENAESNTLRVHTG
jgi:hypothetical protein